MLKNMNFNINEIKKPNCTYKNIFWFILLYKLSEQAFAPIPILYISTFLSVQQTHKIAHYIALSKFWLGVDRFYKPVMLSLNDVLLKNFYLKNNLNI